MAIKTTPAGFRRLPWGDWAQAVRFDGQSDYKIGDHLIVNYIGKEVEVEVRSIPQAGRPPIYHGHIQGKRMQGPRDNYGDIWWYEEDIVRKV